MAFDLHSYLPDDLLLKVDMCTMAHGLEGRSPFLDHRVAEFGARLPFRMKAGRGAASKGILRRAFNHLLPSGIQRRRKQGFEIPLASWLRGPLRDWTYDTLVSQQALNRGLFQSQRVRDLLQDHFSGQRDRHRELWSLLVLETWQRRYVDSRVRLDR
jgi:asparagine synthase (glutamine-hydrolysing)